MTANGESGGVAQTGHGDIVSVERFLRLADQPTITTVVLTASGEILDYGRTRPAAWTEAHHIRAWIRGGRTALNNLCLLCAHHHRTFERAGWSVALIDGIPQWTPPAWLDPSRRPRRNTAHHLPEIDFAR